MTPNRHGSAVIEFPNDLEIVTTREFDAPIELVFDVLTKPEHVSKWFAPFACEVTKCSIEPAGWGELPHGLRDRRRNRMLVSGHVLGGRAAERGSSQTWLFEGWPDADAVEYVDLHETDGVTKLTIRLAFRDEAGRAHMTRSDGQEDSLNKMEDYLRSLLDQQATASD